MLLLGLLPLAACSGGAALPPSAPSPLLGQALPEIRHRSLDGGTISNPALRGRPVVVKFFADWCEPCKRTLPSAERAHRENPDVAFVGVSEDDRASVARAVAARYGLTFSVVHDAGKMLQGRFRVRELPVTFVADSSGRVRWVGGPGQDERDLVRAIKAVR